jgi:hypothetical protein
LDQGQTGTCVSNALAHRFADGPTLHAGIDEKWAQDVYVAATGDTTLQEGTSALDVCRYLKATGRLSGYHWVTSMAELENTLLGVGSVCIGIDWYNSMFDPIDRYGSLYLNVKPSSGLAGGHEVLINGIRLDTVAPEPPFVRLKNSWGRGWGNGGTVRVGFADLAALVFGGTGDCVLITEVP